MSTLTTKDTWRESYLARGEPTDLEFDWRNRSNIVIAQMLESIGLSGKNVLEIGAGDSQWLPYLARKYPESRFAGLDYTEDGCKRLAERADKKANISIDIYHQDMFRADPSLHNQFDVVISFGVIEHFTDLAEALHAKQRFLNDQGVIFSLIPNLAGSIGFLAKRFNRDVFEMHNPHDWASFVDGHQRAGLSVVAGGYLGSTNYGVLSSCFPEQKGLPWHFYLLLTRLSKFVGLLESRFGDFSYSKALSPYIYAISRVE